MCSVLCFFVVKDTLRFDKRYGQWLEDSLLRYTTHKARVTVLGHREGAALPACPRDLRVPDSGSPCRLQRPPNEATQKGSSAVIHQRGDNRMLPTANSHTSPQS